MDAPTYENTPWDELPFREKVRYWRENGGLAVTYQGGRWLWGESTVKQFADRELAIAESQGRTLIPVDENGDPY